MTTGFDLVFGTLAKPTSSDTFNLSFYEFGDEALFRASFEDASGRDPLPTALLDRSDARKLCDHNVICYQYPPMLCTKTIPIELSDYGKTVPGMMIWIKDRKDPLFKMGRWAQIQRRKFSANPLVIELTVRISDHPESFVEPIDEQEFGSL